MSGKVRNIRFLGVITYLFIMLSGSAQDLFFEKYNKIEPIRNAENAADTDWQNYYFSKDDCKCVYGGEFYTAIKKAPAQTKNLMISLQGGGACWPGVIQCKPMVSDEDIDATYFTSELDRRLKADWHQVFIPYCDGSVYFGDKEQDYNGDNKTDHWHDGLKISIAALNLTKKKFPDIEKIFLTGCSAGGYGTIIQLRLIRALYPQSSIYVLNESGPGLLKPDTAFWKVIEESWNLKQLLPKNCGQCKGQLISWYEEMLKDSKVKIGLYSSYTDQVIGQVFLKLGPEKYKSLLLEKSGELNTQFPKQFKRFFIKGNSHCVQNRDYEVRGIRYWDWVLAFINDDQNWKDVLE